MAHGTDVTGTEGTAWYPGSRREYLATASLLRRLPFSEGCLDDDRRSIAWDRLDEQADAAYPSDGEQSLLRAAREIWTGTGVLGLFKSLDLGNIEALYRALGVRLGLVAEEAL